MVFRIEVRLPRNDAWGCRQLMLMPTPPLEFDASEQAKGGGGKAKGAFGGKAKGTFGGKPPRTPAASIDAALVEANFASGVFAAHAASGAEVC